MKFDSEAYGRLFPRTTPKAEVESMVETFKPTEEIEERVEQEQEVLADGNGSISEPVIEQ